MEAKRSILERLRTQLASLTALVEGVPPEALGKRVGQKWSAAENVAHLARYTELTIERVQRILAEKDPAFPPYRAEEDPDWDAWRGQTFDESLERLESERETLIAMVERLDSEELARIGKHARFGPLTLAAWLDFYLVHEGHHIYAILKRSRGLE